MVGMIAPGASPHGGQDSGGFVCAVWRPQRRKITSGICKKEKRPEKEKNRLNQPD